MRLRYRNGKRSVIDGPFTESKVLIGGFCMVQMRSLDEVREWCNRFAKISGGTSRSTSAWPEHRTLLERAVAAARSPSRR